MEKICKTCKKVFVPKDDRLNRPAKFCSRKCIRNKTQFKKGIALRLGLKPPKYAWNNEGSKKTRFKKGHAFGFKKGFTPWNKGKDFGGTDYIVNRVRSLSIYRDWKKEIIKRDKQCIKCGKKKTLNVDHYPISLVELIRKYNVKKPQETKQYKEFWDINNGRALCLKCHKKTDTYGKNFVQKV